MLQKLLTATVIAGATLSFSIQAEDRALLIGVGEYQNPKFNLPGIDLDINMMQKAAKLMGYDSIKTILNDGASLNNVTRTMEDYLVNGVSANDRVLIYYSGHGTRIPDLNGDEKEDGADEVLTMYDLQQAKIQGKNSLTGVLIDDKFNEILTKIPSKNILVLLDACNSGTATKSISLTRSILGEGIKTYSKSLLYPGMPMMAKSNFMVQEKEQKQKAKGDFIAISAAGDTESAQATAKGSLFTLGILKSVTQAAQNNTQLTPNIIKTQATEFILQENTKDPFTPRLSGNEQLANKLIKLRIKSDGYGDTWNKLASIADKAEPLKITLNQASYVYGEHLVISINNNKSGYLNVINVGPKDDATVLFPNKYNLDSKVSGSVTIPTNEMKFDLPASKPFGASLIVAFLTDKPLNLYNSGDASRDSKGNIGDLFHSISALGLDNIQKSFNERSFSVAEKTNTSGSGSGIRAGKVITRVCASKCQ